MENELKLYRKSSIISATTGEAVSKILSKKAEEYNYSESKLLDYIGKALNDIQIKINDLQYDKVFLEIQLKHAKEQKELIENLIAEGLELLGLSELKDKTSDILSSLTIEAETETIIASKQRKLTQSEMETILKGYGESLYIVEDVEIQGKPKTIKANFKRGCKVSELTTKAIKESIKERFEKLENEN